MPKRPDRPILYVATDRWLEAVETGGSLFDPAVPVWRPSVIAGLVSRVWTDADHGPTGFQEKLRGQASQEPQPGGRLAAEAMFVFFLKDASGLATTKRRIVGDLLDGAGPVTVPDDLEPAFGFGLVRYGAGRARSLYDYLYVLRFAAAWATASPAERASLRSDPWAFRTFAADVEHYKATFAMEALKHLVHPDTFEPVASQQAKRLILRRLGGVHVGSGTDLDRELEGLRGRLAGSGPAYPPDFGFYDAAVRPLWDANQSDLATEDVPAEEAGDDVPATGVASASPSLTLADLRKETESLNLEVPDQVLVGVLAALTSGKHVVLTGAPGTAKTTLAVAVATVAARLGLCDGHQLVTATADWSTFETVGGYQLQKDSTLLFEPGVVLQAIRDNRWLVLDEMNRANTDRALGPLFTVLSGQSVVLPQQQDGLPVRIRTGADDGLGRHRDYEVTPGWRIVATTNVLDRALLFDLSFALMRRFAFVEVLPPDHDSYRGLVRDAVADLNAGVVDDVQRIVDGLLPLTRRRPLGPALFMDAARHAARHLELAPGSPDGDVALAVFQAYLLPQYEGVSEDDAAAAYRTVLAAVGPGNGPALLQTMRRTLGVELAGRSRPAADEPDDDTDADDEP